MFDVDTTSFGYKKRRWQTDGHVAYVRSFGE